MKDIIRRTKPGGRILLFLDYDGTIVPIKKAPGLARLHPSRRHFLKRLSKRALVCIVSGRSLAEIRKLVAIEGIDYIGNHGLEISHGQKIWIHPEARKIQAVLKDTLESIRNRTRDMSGVLIEDKGLTGSIHYRRLTPAYWKPLKKIIQVEVGSRRQELKLTEGKRVFEIRPNIQWDKGQGVQKLSGWLDPRKTTSHIYIGDDQTDEDAFKVFDSHALTILVGNRKSTNARYHLADVNRVWRFIRALFLLNLAPKKRSFKKTEAKLNAKRSRGNRPWRSVKRRDKNQLQSLEPLV